MTWAIERLYSERMTSCLAAYAPKASEALQIAARAQHVQRWRIERGQYPEGRTGYKQWRAKLASLHAELAEQVCRDVGYDDDFATRVGGLIQKRQMKTDQESQTLEDVVCLVFVTHYLDDFAGRHADDAVVTILQKTWGRMSVRGQATALDLATSARTSALLARALDAGDDHDDESAPANDEPHADAKANANDGDDTASPAPPSVEYPRGEPNGSR